MMTASIRGINIAVSLMQGALSLLDGPENVAIAEHLRHALNAAVARVPAQANGAEQHDVQLPGSEP